MSCLANKAESIGILVKRLVIALTLFVAACGGSAPSGSSSPMFITETFTGSTAPPSWIGPTHIVTVHSFASPNVNVTLTQASLLPASKLVVNIADLLPNGTCLPHWSQLAVPSTSPQLSEAMQPGQYCILVADATGGAPVSYTVVVSHL